MFVVVVVAERVTSILEVMHKSVLPKDIKMPAATLTYPQYTYHRCGGGI